jgi:hypothetical protein
MAKFKLTAGKLFHCKENVGLFGFVREKKKRQRRQQTAFPLLALKRKTEGAPFKPG